MSAAVRNAKAVKHGQVVVWCWGGHYTQFMACAVMD